MLCTDVRMIPEAQTARRPHRRLELIRDVTRINFIKVSGSERTDGAAGNSDSKLDMLTLNICPGNPQLCTTFMMSSVSLTQVFLLSAMLHFTTSLPVRAEDEVESFLTEIRHLNAPWSLSGMNSAETLLKARLTHLLSVGLDRRRQLGDIEFSNRYAEFLRSKAKHISICSFLRRVKKSGGDVERVNLLLQQFMCPSVYNNWPNDL
ncbi:unnamed protein product [Pleuronectes platessa]|uniref:Uncharacterized protein n=1 Tax=Pleuronectes platessa TaxID=8262 RepID=A0A9N7VX97_PLEPL|nr:unnamed protein product [Pleuronectes platessa]